MPQQLFTWLSLLFFSILWPKFYEYLCDRRTFWLPIWAPQGTAMLVHSLPTKSIKRLAHDVTDILALFVTSKDADSQKQNSSAHGCIFRPFKQSKSTRLTVQRFKSRTLKNLKKQAWKQKSYCKDNPEVVEHVNVLWHSLLTPLDQVILTETKSSSSSSPY